jgi:hypothetical protein
VRVEHDLLGERAVPASAYYGVHTLRALENFPITAIPISVYPALVNALDQAVRIELIESSVGLDIAAKDFLRLDLIKVCPLDSNAVHFRKRGAQVLLIVSVHGSFPPVPAALKRSSRRSPTSDARISSTTIRRTCFSPRAAHSSRCDGTAPIRKPFCGPAAVVVAEAVEAEVAVR